MVEGFAADAELAGELCLLLAGSRTTPQLGHPLRCERPLAAPVGAALFGERTLAGLASARARGRKGGWPFKMTAAKLRLAMAAMGQPETKVGDLCQELGITRQTLYRHISPKGELRPDGAKLLAHT